MATIVVPFRGPARRGRLGPLPGGTRLALALAMLGDVLSACTVTAETLLVTADPDGRAVAKELEARTVDDPGGGQSEAVAAALREIREGAVLVVAADLPCAVPQDLRDLEAATPDDGIAVVASEGGGANALGLAGPSLYAPLLGPGSAGLFRAHADRLGVDFVSATLPNLADDVDELEDLERVALRVGPRTLAVIAPPRSAHGKA